MRYYDNTRISDYRTCPRKYYFRHEKGWVREGTAIALINGLAWHDSMDVVWARAHEDISDVELTKAALQAYVNTWTAEGLPHSRDMTMEQQEFYTPRGPFIAAETLMQYVLQRRRFIRDSEILAIERPFAVPIYEDETPIMYIGRLDKVIRHKLEGTLIVEHKTTTQYYKTSGLRQSFVDSFSPNSQVDGYLHAGNILYEKLRGVWIDVAVFNKTQHDAFKFLPIDRQYAMLDSWLHEVKNWIERLEDDKQRYPEHKLMGSYPKNTDRCGDYGGCPFVDVCKFYADPDGLASSPPGFKVDFWNPFDVLHLDQVGLKPEGTT